MILPARRLYANSSPFNSPIVSKAERPNAAAMRKALIEEGIADHAVFFGGHAGHRTWLGGDYYHPLYSVPSGSPTYTVSLTKNWGTKITSTPCSPDAEPAVGGDGHLALFAGEREIDFWQAKVDHQARHITASWGGELPASGSGTGVGPATAASFGLGAGMIRIYELESPRMDAIHHALFLSLPKAPGVVLPAVHRGWPPEAPPACPLGTHLMLNYTRREIEALPAALWQKKVIFALSHYGGIVGDQSGGPLFGPESSQPWLANGKPDPMVAIAEREGCPSWKGVYTFALGDLVDWSRLRILA